MRPNDEFSAGQADGCRELMLRVALPGKNKRVGCGALQLPILAVKRKAKQQTFLRKHFTENRHGGRVVSIARDDDRDVERIAGGVGEDLGDDVHVGGFFLPDALEAAERFDPDLFRFEMSEIDLHAGGSEGAHVGAMA